MTRWIPRTDPRTGIVRRHPEGLSPDDRERFEERAGFGEDEGLVPREAEERAARLIKKYTDTPK